MKPPSKFTLTLSVGFKINKKRPNSDKKITQDNILISLRVVLLILASVMLKGNLPYLKTTKRADDLMDLSGIFKCV